MISTNRLATPVMEFLRVGESVLRSQQHPILSFLAPQARRTAITSRAYTPRAAQLQSQTKRTFATTSGRRQDDSANSRQGKPQTGPSLDSEMASMLDDTLDLKKGTPTTSTSRTSKFKSPAAQTQNPPTRGIAQNSANDMFEAAMARPRAQPSRSPNRHNVTNDYSSSNDISSLLNPLNNPTQPAKARGSNQPPSVSEVPSIKLNASVGRTVTVDSSKGMDVGKAFRSLDMAINRNQVRKHERLQRFHERPGLKRKRLKSERWRRRFKAGFKKIVKRVQDMKAQGW
ncbi:hypothetical protein MBLNU230_g5624t1 [Neophaeotheca triangularis]